MHRDPLGKLVPVLLLTAAGSLAAITRYPDAELVAAAGRWPVVGTWIDAFAEKYRVRPLPETSGESFDASRIEIVYAIDRGRREARPRVWVPQGSVLLSEPSTDAERVATTTATANLEHLEQRGDWVQVRYRESHAWLRLGDRPTSSMPPLGSEPALTLPVPARSADPEFLKLGIDLLGAPPAPDRKLGPYLLHTDVLDVSLLAFLDRVAERVEPLYGSRYGLQPVGQAAESVVLFATREAYTEFQKANQLGADPDSPGFVHAGVVAMFVGDRERTELAATLIHELTHLLNRRAVGPALPPWLEEGIADDMAQSYVTDEGDIRLGQLGGSYRREASRIEWRGGRAAGIDLTRALDRNALPSLEELIEKDWQQFQEISGRSLRYAQASFWIRSLLDPNHPELARGLRSFLAAVAAGEPLTGELLRKNLSLAWDELDARLANFVRFQVTDDSAG